MLSKYHHLLLFLLFPLLAFSQTDTLPLFGARSEVKPAFPGGEQALLQFLSDNLKYPKNAKEKAIAGTVYTRFTIDTAGYVVNPEIVRGIDAELDAEALRLVKLMPKWQPGILEGKLTPVTFTMPLIFKLEDTPLFRSGPNTVADSLDGSVGIYFGSGVNALMGSISDYAGSMATVQLGTHFAIKRLNFLLNMDFSFGTKTKQAFDANGYWRKGRNIGILSPQLLVGYTAYEAKRREFMPFTGVSLNGFLPSDSEDGDPQNGFGLDNVSMSIGAMAFWRYSMKDRGPNRFNTRLLRFSLAYNYLEFNDFLKGSSLVLSVCWGTEQSSKNRFKRRLTPSSY